jgi:hypothetical protein
MLKPILGTRIFCTQQYHSPHHILIRDPLNPKSDFHDIKIDLTDESIIPNIKKTEFSSVISNLFKTNIPDKDDIKVRNNINWNINYENYKNKSKLFKIAEFLIKKIEDNTDILDGLDKNNKYDFALHLMSKGEHVIKLTLETPEFCRFIKDIYIHVSNIINDDSDYYIGDSDSD